MKLYLTIYLKKERHKISSSLKSRVEFYLVIEGNKTIPIVDMFPLRLDNL